MKEAHCCSFANYCQDRTKVVEAFSKKHAAEKFASYAHDNWDMWEVYRVSDILEVYVDGDIFSVEMEIEPVFIASKKDKDNINL